MFKASKKSSHHNHVAVASSFLLEKFVAVENARKSVQKSLLPQARTSTQPSCNKLAAVSLAMAILMFAAPFLILDNVHNGGWGVAVRHMSEQPPPGTGTETSNNRNDEDITFDHNEDATHPERLSQMARRLPLQGEGVSSTLLTEDSLEGATVDQTRSTVVVGSGPRKHRDTTKWLSQFHERGDGDKTEAESEVEQMGQMIHGAMKEDDADNASKESKTHKPKCHDFIEDRIPVMTNLHSLTRRQDDSKTDFGRSNEFTGDEHGARGKSFPHSAFEELSTSVAIQSSDPIVTCNEATRIANAGDVEYPCHNTDLMSFLTPTDLYANYLVGGSRKQHYLNDIWGWTDPESNREFAIVGTINGTSFVEITDPTRPIVKGFLPHRNNKKIRTGSKWADIKTYKHYAYIVTEAENQGLEIFDLNLLLNKESENVIYEETAHFDGFGNSHNIAINEESGYAYAVGTDKCEGGLIILDLTEPMVPVNSSCVLGDDGKNYGHGEYHAYTHDTHCVNYKGPDPSLARGAEICIACNDDRVVIFDVSNKLKVRVISELQYEGVGYTHQGWLSEDHRYFFFGDEYDERYNIFQTTTYVADLQNLAHPVMANIYRATGAQFATDHNLYVRGNYVFQANYRAGFQYFHREEEKMALAGYFDIWPSDDAVRLNGAWSVYPYYSSGNVVVSGMEQGLYVLRPKTPKDPRLKWTRAPDDVDDGWIIQSRGDAYAFDIDTTKTNALRMTFSFNPREMKNGVSLYLKMSTESENGGYTTIKSWVKNVHFRHHDLYKVSTQIPLRISAYPPDKVWLKLEVKSLEEGDIVKIQDVIVEKEIEA